MTVSSLISLTIKLRKLCIINILIPFDRIIFGKETQTMWFSGSSWCNNYTTSSHFLFCRMRIIPSSALCVDCGYYIRQRMMMLVRKWKHIILIWRRSKLAMASTGKCAVSPLCISPHHSWISNYMYPAKPSFTTLHFEMSHWKYNLPYLWSMAHRGLSGCHIDIWNCTGKVLSTEHKSGKSFLHGFHSLSAFPICISHNYMKIQSSTSLTEWVVWSMLFVLALFLLNKFLSNSSESKWKHSGSSRSM